MTDTELLNALEENGWDVSLHGVWWIVYKGTYDDEPQNIQAEAPTARRAIEIAVAKVKEWTQRVDEALRTSEAKEK